MTMPLFAPARRPRRQLRRAAPPHRPRRPCRSCPRAPPGCRVHPRHDRASRVRYADGVVMAGDRRATARQPHQPPHDGEGLPGRPPQRRRHRRRGRPGHGDGQALPAPARALREGRGHAAQPRGQGQPALADGAQQPARGDAGPGRRAALRRLRRAARPGPPVPVRRHRRPLRGDATTRPPARAACTPAPSSSSATATAWTATTPSTSCVKALFEAADEDSATGGPDLRAGHLPGRGHHHRRGLRARARTTSCADRFEAGGGARLQPCSRLVHLEQERGA